MAITSLLGAGLRGFIIAGARGLGQLGVPVLAGLWGLQGIFHKDDLRQKSQLNMAKFMGRSTKGLFHPLSVYMGNKGDYESSTIAPRRFYELVRPIFKIDASMLPNEVSMLGPGFYGAIREVVLGGLKNKKGQPGIVQPAPGNSAQDYGEHPDITEYLGTNREKLWVQADIVIKQALTSKGG